MNFNGTKRPTSQRQIRLSAATVLATATLMLVAPARAAPMKMKPVVAKSQLKFLATVSVFPDATGTFKKWTGSFDVDTENIAASKASITVKTASVDTGSSGRDEHLRQSDFFDCAKYPDMKFVSTGFEAKGKDKVLMSGKLTIRDVTKAITVPLSITWSGAAGKKTLRVQGTFKLDRFKHGLQYKAPFYKPNVGKMVTITLDVLAAQ